MTISMTETALDIEKKAIRHCARRNPFRSWLAWTYCSVFLLSFSLFYIFWCTNSLRDYVQSQMVLRNGTRSFVWWQQPPFELTYKVHIFNYTNVEDFEAGRVKKLRVQEVGPYIYRETMNRVNVQVNGNGTVTYQTKKSYQWIGGKPDNETVLVPNVPLMASTAFVRDLDFGIKFSLTMMLSALQEKSFVRVNASGFLWGYDDDFFNFVNKFSLADHKIPIDKFGMLALNQGLNKNRITMYTGAQDINNLGMIERVNGKKRRDIWDDERCDKIEGTDGSRFPPHLLENTNEPLYVYSTDMCRKMPLRFSEHTVSNGIPALRYKVPMDAFNYSNEQNQCFCSKIRGSRVCPPLGVFNMSACSYNTPMLGSFPHFYMADKSLLKQIDGLNPRQEDHETYLDLHPRLAVPISGWSRVQLNIEVRKASSVPFLDKLKDGMVLPLIWIESGMNELPEPVLEVLYMAHFTVGTVEAVFQWCSLIAMILSMGALVACLKKHRMEQLADLQRVSSGENEYSELPYGHKQSDKTAYYEELEKGKTENGQAQYRECVENVKESS